MSKLLLDLGRIDKNDIKASKPKVGQIIITPKTTTKVFTAILINRHFDSFPTQDLESLLTTLADVIVEHKIKTIRISKSNDITDKITFSTFLDLLKAKLRKCDCTIYVCYGSSIVPPDDVREGIISENHSSMFGGHRGITKTYRRIREKYFWPGLKADITEHIRNCITCQEYKLVRIKNREPMIITDTPIEAFDKISIDTVGPLPLTPDGNKHILTVQDNLTKYCIAIPVPDIKAETIADALARHVITLYGSPRIILSDKAPALIGKVMQQLEKIFKIKQVTTSGYHPQSNGGLERSHLVLIEYIRQYIEKFEDWDKVLPFATFSYNTSVHESTNFTPFELIFGKTARTPSAFPTDVPETYTSYMTDLVTRLKDVRNFSSKALINSKIKSKHYYDRKAKTHQYSVEDMVYVIKEPRTNKLDKMYKGPYTIVDVLEKHNVVLEDDTGKRILKHVDKIKPAYHQ